ncbi:MAG: hypothetical protein WC435_02695 [Candidatus Paceibacterota bacterium]
MCKNKVVVPVSILTPEWLEKRRGIFAELDKQLIQNVVNPSVGLTLEQLQFITEHKNPFVDVGGLLANWRIFYRDEFNIELGEVKVPEIRFGFDRLLVIAQGLTIQRVYDKCEQCFQCWRWADENFDKAVPINDRLSADGSYAIWVHDRVEADEEHKNKSAAVISQAEVAGITLLERLLFELKYFRETGKHLDIASFTSCDGSRNTLGCVPFVRFHGGVVSVGWCSFNSAADFLRARGVVC